jgi:hypothetical protein
MNQAQLSHPSPEQLSAFGLGKLDEETSATLEAHLADCPQCRQALEHPQADSFVARLREAGPAQTATGASTPSGPADRPGGTDVPPELAHHPRYRVLQVLGVGGMGVVYKAEHLLMGRLVALKVISHALTGDPAAVERFQREVRAAARLNHPNIVTAHDAEQAGDLHFLVMEYVEGVSLDRLVAERGRLPVLQACDYIRQAALGLQHACERGMVHRDVKPQNLMLTPRGEVKVLDFGLARFAQESTSTGLAPPAGPAGQPVAPGQALTQTGAVMGTPDYIAPEQVLDAHAADARADIYALGCTLYHLLAGQVPFPKDSALDKLLAHHDREPRPLPELRQDLPPGLAQVVERMMAKDLNRRYQAPAEVAHALAAYTTPEGARPAAPPGPAEAPQPPRRGRLRRALLTGGLIGGPLLLFLVLTQTGRRETLGESMETLYTVCAILGGTLLACQFLLGALGLGHHHDVGGHDLSDAGGHDLDGHDGAAEGDHEVGHATQVSRFAGALTFRAVVAGLTFFGLAGRAAEAAEVPPGESFLVALGAGAAALFGVAWLMRAMYRLKAEGTVRIQRAVGQTGTVYLTVPGGRSGAGKVHLNLQNRTVEYQAVTPGEPLPTGSRVAVVAVVGTDTVEVIPAPTPERARHV